ncbi:2'-5' RNA ligase family protein [Bosea sp. NPDC003192]|uniref:2'-5' RNA ligase family protein n=1 Tax=Bosea sp. NPDC003192 TaxID=3390551 RepID=UPI003CFD33FC
MGRPSPDQPDLFGWGPRYGIAADSDWSKTLIAPGWVRYFFALAPPIEHAAAIHDFAHGLRRSHGLRGWPIGPERYHLTLCGIERYGGSASEEIAALEKVAASVVATRFTVAFDHVAGHGSLGDRQAIFLETSQTFPILDRLQKSLRREMRARGFRTPSKFRPHVTLLYDECPFDKPIIPPASFPVREFVLIRSVHGASHHDHLARWPLRDHADVA